MRAITAGDTHRHAHTLTRSHDNIITTCVSPGCEQLHCYCATASRSSAAPSCSLLDPVPPASLIPPTISSHRYSIDGCIPSNLTSSIELSCFSPVAQNNLLLLTSRSSPISLSEILSQLCNGHARSNQCAHTLFTSEQQAVWWCPRHTSKRFPLRNSTRLTNTFP